MFITDVAMMPVLAVAFKCQDNKGEMKMRSCIKCKRVLQNTTFDKCMYCGEEIPVEQRLSNSQKEEIANKQKEAHEAQMRKKTPSSNNDDSVISTAIIMGDSLSGFDFD